MESMLAGKSRHAVLHAAKALLPALVETWGQPEAFRQQGAEVLENELGGSRRTQEQLAGQIYTTVAQLRSLQMRHIGSQQELLQVQRRLESTFASSPLRQGCLWLAARARQEGLAHLHSQEGQVAYQRLIAVLDEQRGAIARRFQEREDLTLDLVETGLAAIATSVMGKAKNPYHRAVLAGELLERARRQARRHPEDATVPADFSDNTAEVRVVAALEEPVRQAELHEARQRFLSLNDHQKGQRYEALRKIMMRHMHRIAPYAPPGFDTFCRAVESVAFPYPAPLEWVRVFLKPLHANARQSSIFDQCRTMQSIDHRYQKVRQEPSVNPIMLELARAFAVSGMRSAQEESMHQFVREVDPAREFHWPTELGQLERALRPH